MDTVYSLTLLAALVAGSVGVIAGGLALQSRGSRARSLALWSGLLAIAFGAVSFTVHLACGHGPAAPEPMNLGRFLSAHPAYGIVVLLVLATFGVLLWSRRRV